MKLNLKKESTEKKIKPKVQAETTGFDAQKAANKYKKLEKQLKEIDADPKVKKMRDELARLKKELVADANTNLAGEEGVVYITPAGDVKIGKRGTARSITDMDKAVELLGHDTFMKIAKIGLADLDKYLNPEELELVTVTKVTDTRRVS